ncbi:hypothetical protein Trydic_g13448 [Trypoxylus dichotomus]
MKKTGSSLPTGCRRHESKSKRRRGVASTVTQFKPLRLFPFNVDDPRNQQEKDAIPRSDVLTYRDLMDAIPKSRKKNVSLGIRELTDYTKSKAQLQNFSGEQE